MIDSYRVRQFIVAISTLGFGGTVAAQQEVAKLVPDDPESGARFGNSGSMDGSRAIVGAFEDDQPNASDAGSTYIFEETSPGVWEQVIKFFAESPLEDDFFGQSVGISGDFAIVGAPGRDIDQDQNAGQAFVYKRVSGEWVELRTLTAPEPDAFYRFGQSVAIDGSIAVVGAYTDDEIANQAGAAYIYYRNEGGTDNWGFVKQITASDAAAGDWFGFSVALDGDVVVVGAPTKGPTLQIGAAYVFYRNTGGSDNWGQVAKLTSRTNHGTVNNDNFGWAVAVGGDIAVIGEPAEEQGTLTDAGSVDIFRRDEGGTDNWGHVIALASTRPLQGGVFGQAVTTNGTLAVIGAPGENLDADDEDSGIAYAIRRNCPQSGQWSSERLLSDC